MRLSRLRSLQAVEAVLRLGSFRAAAEELSITPAAVGQRVRALEDHLGQRLFERTASGVVPSPAARSVAADLTAGVTRLAAAFQRLDNRHEDNRLALSLTQAFAENWLPRQLSDFIAKVDRVDIRIETSRALADLTSGEFDFAVRYTGAPGSGHEGVPLFRGCLAPVCTPDFARRYGLGPDCDDLNDVPLVHLDDPTTDPAWVDWWGWCAALGVAVPRNPRRQTRSRLTSGLRIAGTGLGLALVGLVEAMPALREGRLIMPFGDRRALRMDYCYWLVWNADRRLTPLQRKFRAWIAERAEQERSQTYPRLLTP